MTEKEINQLSCQEAAKWSSRGTQQPKQQNKHEENSFPLIFALNGK